MSHVLLRLAGKSLPPMGESFGQKDSLITHILFELWPITLLRFVLVFLTQTLQKSWQFLSLDARYQEISVLRSFARPQADGKLKKSEIKETKTT